MTATKIQNDPPAGTLPEWLQFVCHQVGSLRCGAVEIVVHDSRVTQIEKVERMRLDKPLPETNQSTKTEQ